MICVSLSPAETLAAGENLGRKLRGGETILLRGELGAGKTVFAKGIAKGLGVSARVLSPTFTIMNEYEGERLKLFHFDAYRLSCGEEAEEAGLTEFLGRLDGVCVIEWPENMVSALNFINCGKVEIRYAGEQKREIEISGF